MSSLGGGNSERAATKIARFHVFSDTMAMPALMARYVSALGPRRRVWAASGKAAGPRAAVTSANGRISDKFRDGHEGQALAQAQRQLERLDWEVRCRETFDYPHNITNIASASSEERRCAIIGLMAPRIESVAGNLASGSSRMRPCRAWALFVGWPLGCLYRILGRRAWAMLFAADERCDGCSACAASCPVGAIKIVGGRPAWSYAREGCERCTNLCPKQAIQTSILRTVLILALLACSFVPVPPALVGESRSILPAWSLHALWSIAATVLGFFALRIVDLGLIQARRLRLDSLDQALSRS